jgi:addiction module HigA family antidote
MRIPRHREPTHPGDMLKEEFLIPMKISQKDLANALHVPYQRINELINKKRGVTPSTALRLAKFFGTSASYWLNLQIRCDLYKAKMIEENDLSSIVNFNQLQKTA